MAEPPRLFGHPLHPVTVHLPVGLLAAVSVWDVLSVVRPDGPWSQVATWNLVLGLAGVVLAASTGLLDLAAVAGHPGRARVATWHVALMSTAACGYGASLALRWGGAAPAACIATAAGGLVVLGLGGWAGGHLVYRYGTGVHREPP